jgi:hypothetical protein
LNARTSTGRPARQRHLEAAPGERQTRPGQRRAARTRSRVDLQPDDLDVGRTRRSRSSSSTAVTPLAP